MRLTYLVCPNSSQKHQDRGGLAGNRLQVDTKQPSDTNLSVRVLLESDPESSASERRR
jgi:hypothetical protein